MSNQKYIVKKNQQLVKEICSLELVPCMILLLQTLKHLSNHSSTHKIMIYQNKINHGEKYKKVFDFIQRKVEYENFRFKYPTLIGIVIESLPTNMLDNQSVPQTSDKFLIYSHFM